MDVAPDMLEQLYRDSCCNNGLCDMYLDQRPTLSIGDPDEIRRKYVSDPGDSLGVVSIGVLQTRPLYWKAPFDSISCPLLPRKGQRQCGFSLEILEGREKKSLVVR